MYRSLEDIGAAAFDAARPATFMTVAQAGQRYHEVEPSGLHRGKWSPELTPYLLEPQEILTSLEFQGMVLVAPARTGKSALLPNWLAYSAMADPADFLLVHSSQHEARNWSLSDLNKFLRRSVEVKARMIPGRKNDNVFDKEFLSGMRWLITWPTIGNLSGKTIMRHWLLDYDRIPQNVDGEGIPFDLTKKRAESYMRFGMTVAESSPGFPISDPKWMASSPHEAPPADGILKLYNRGDRRRWFWKCEQCGDTFEPSFSLFDFPGKHDPKSVFQDPMEAAEQVTLPCPHCGYPHTHSMKRHLNDNGRWVRDGMVWKPDGSMDLREGGRLIRSDIASFWLKGPAAVFQTWTNMVLAYLRAEKEFEDTGDEKPLIKSFNTDMGEPYIPKAMISDRTPEALKNKAEDWGATSDFRSVPPWVRFLVCTIDVQARSNASFPFQVHGFSAEGDITIIDSDKIAKSSRVDESGDRLRVDPAAFAEDWDVLIDLMERTYPLGDGSGRRMGILFTGCDSGGVEGVTLNAYNFWRRLKDDEERRGLHRKFGLIKGRGGKNLDVVLTKADAQTPPTRVLWPESNRTDRFAGGKGDVPVIELNPWLLKDRASNMLLRRIRDDDAGSGGSVRTPTWMPDWLYSQLTNEVRTSKGWDKIGSRRNEAWDLLYYALGLALRPREHASEPMTGWTPIRFDKIAWENPPDWAKPWEENSLVWSGSRVEQKVKDRKKISFADLAKDLG